MVHCVDLEKKTAIYTRNAIRMDYSARSTKKPPLLPKSHVLSHGDLGSSKPLTSGHLVTSQVIEAM